MDEKEYWLRLEFRVCREFSDMRERRLRTVWCDGLRPKQYCICGRRPRVVGEAWICYGYDQQLWEFTLTLLARVKSREQNDWEFLLPSVAVTRWLSIDEEHRRITIEPTVAIADIVNIANRKDAVN
jgi:hypothetical protein